MFILIHYHSYLLTSPGSQSKTVKYRKTLKSVDFQRFLFLPKQQNNAEYNGQE